MTVDPQTAIALATLELDKRAKARRDRPDLRVDLFGPQADVWDDDGQTLLVLCSRRAGKSELIIRWLLAGALALPGFLFPYIAQSRKNAKLIAWEALKRVLRQHKIQATINEADLTARLPNGSTVILGGCNDRSEVERWRGLKCGRVAIDECGAMPYLAELVETVRPSLMDVAGPMLLAGTPGLVWSGLWYELTGPGRTTEIPLHSWTLFQNPHIPAAHDEAHRYKRERGWDDDNPTWRREYLGRWAYDAELLVFPWDPQDHAAELPKFASPWRYVLGIDDGYVNARGYCLIACHVNDPHDYVLRSWRRTEQLTDAMAHEVRGVLSEFPSCQVVMDTGGMGRPHAEELRRRYAIPVLAAEKREKASALRVSSDRVKARKVIVLDGPQNDAIRDDFALCQWNADRTDIAEDSDDKSDHRDVAHAFLYAHRHMRNYLYREPQQRPKPGTPEYAAATEEKLERQHIERHRQRNDQPRWDR